MTRGTACWILRLFGFHGKSDPPSDLSVANESIRTCVACDGVEPEYYDAAIAAEYDYRPIAINPWLY